MKKTEDHKYKLSKKMKTVWDNPEYRKMMVEKQIKAGLRLPNKK